MDKSINNLHSKFTKDIKSDDKNKTPTLQVKTQSIKRDNCKRYSVLKKACLSGLFLTSITANAAPTGSLAVTSFNSYIMSPDLNTTPYLNSLENPYTTSAYATADFPLNEVSITKEYTDAMIKDLEYQAKHGNSTASVDLANIYIYGEEGQTKNLDKAYDYLRHAANSDNMEAQLKLAYLEKEYDKGDSGLEMLKIAADNGSPDAAYELGRYFEGRYLEARAPHDKSMQEKAGKYYNMANTNIAQISNAFYSCKVRVFLYPKRLERLFAAVKFDDPADGIFSPAIESAQSGDLARTYFAGAFLQVTGYNSDYIIGTQLIKEAADRGSYAAIIHMAEILLKVKDPIRALAYMYRAKDMSYAKKIYDVTAIGYHPNLFGPKYLAKYGLKHVDRAILKACFRQLKIQNKELAVIAKNAIFYDDETALFNLADHLIENSKKNQEPEDYETYLADPNALNLSKHSKSGIKYIEEDDQYADYQTDIIKNVYQDTHVIVKFAQEIYKYLIEQGFFKAKIALADLYNNPELNLPDRATARKYIMSVLKDPDALQYNKVYYSKDNIYWRMLKHAGDLNELSLLKLEILLMAENAGDKKASKIINEVYIPHKSGFFSWVGMVRSIIKSYSSGLDYYIWMGLAFEVRGNTDFARSYYEKSKSLNLNYDLARLLLKRLG